jgi:hydroxypyruvate reductase
MPARRNLASLARRIFNAALKAVDPYEAVRRKLSVCGERLVIESETSIDLTKYRQLWVVGTGKATASMARASEEILKNRVTGGIVTVKYGYSSLLARIEVVEAGHPVPDEAGRAGAGKICNLLESCGKNDLVLALISGGGSALLVSPAPGISLADKRDITSQLLSSGATIQEINCVRKHLSLTKGGQLARLAQPATVLVLVISDVIGDSLETIASGPFAPDPTTYAQALEVLERYGLSRGVPESVREHLRKGAAGNYPETPKPGERFFRRVHHSIIASNRQALEAAHKKAEQLGLSSMILSSMVQGEAREVAKVYAALLKEEASYDRPLSRPSCLLAGGETTVTLRGNGCGGRNMELALTAALELEGISRVALLSGATDGTDGPTDAAGGIVDGKTCERARRLGINPSRYLADNDSYGFFERLGEIFRTGPTLTNVMDLHILLAG